MTGRRSPTLDRPPVELARPAAPARRLPGWLVAGGLLIGLALGYLIGAYAADSVPRAPTTSLGAVAGESAPATTGTSLPPVPLVEAAPELARSQLLAVDSGSGLEVVRLPARTERAQRTRLPFTPGTTRLEFDASGRWMSALTHSIFDQALYVGPPDDLPRPVFLDVGSAAWHPVDPGRLAWTALGPAGPALFRGLVRPDGLNGEVVASVEDVEHLLGWGGWGYLLGREDDDCGGIRVLDPSGVETSARSGWTFEGATSSGRVLLRECGVSPSRLSLTDTELEDVQLLDWAPRQPSLVHWSPDGRRIAFAVRQAEGSRVEVLDIGGRAEASVEIPQPLSVDWSSADHVVLSVPGGRVVVVDLEREATITLKIGRSLLDAVLR